MTEVIIQDNAILVKEIAIFWHIEDVQSIRPDLSDEKASIVLKHLKKIMMQVSGSIGKPSK